MVTSLTLAEAAATWEDPRKPGKPKRKPKPRPKGYGRGDDSYVEVDALRPYRTLVQYVLRHEIDDYKFLLQHGYIKDGELMEWTHRAGGHGPRNLNPEDAMSAVTFWEDPAAPMVMESAGLAIDPLVARQAIDERMTREEQE